MLTNSRAQRGTARDESDEPSGRCRARARGGAASSRWWCWRPRPCGCRPVRTIRPRPPPRCNCAHSSRARAPKRRPSTRTSRCRVARFPRATAMRTATTGAPWRGSCASFPAQRVDPPPHACGGDRDRRARPCRGHCVCGHGRPADRLGGCACEVARRSVPFRSRAGERRQRVAGRPCRVATGSARRFHVSEPRAHDRPLKEREGGAAARLGGPGFAFEVLFEG